MTRGGDLQHTSDRREQMLRWLRKHPDTTAAEIRRHLLYLFPTEKTLRTDLELLESRGIVRRGGTPTRWSVIA
jgi:DeoR/GlpR family transcriptional regulator of sugar metabolism